MERKLMSRKELVENHKANLSNIKKVIQPFAEEITSPDAGWLKAKIGETFFYIRENIGEKTSFRFYVFLSVEDKTFNPIRGYRRTDEDDYWNHDLTLLEFYGTFEYWLKKTNQLGTA